MNANIEHVIQGHHQVIVIGQTGMGKSTLINTWLSHDQERTYNNPVIAIPMEHYPTGDPNFRNRVSTENDPNNQMSSQTNKCSIYTMKNIQVIDTPGFADSNGSDKDKVNLKLIEKVIMDRGYITAVVLLLDGTRNRMTPQDQYVINSVRGLFPDKLLENLVIVFTRCRSRLSLRYPLKDFCQNVAVPQKTLCLDNVVLGTNPNMWKGNLDLERQLKKEWKAAMFSMAQLSGIFDALAPVSNNVFKEYSEIRQRGMAKIDSIMTDIKNLSQLKRQLTAIIVDEEAARLTVDEYNKKITETSVAKIRWINDDSKGHSTV
ncbi:hypothetical protein HK100_001825 [Physocladia obscura]|uniref:AIG1-type G domain-containing protein n=1 Tax=Physocladia obscura TaxID=109957 RepID=A0AAD5SWN9_9FUNG|nr:hypothetical protein HK100_001825 [Physocladia obscura]